MTRSFGSGRTLLAGAVGFACMCGGAGLAFKLITPEAVGRLSTVELLGLLALLLLPMALWWTLAVERRRAMRGRGVAQPACPLVYVEIKPMRCPECQRPLARECGLHEASIPGEVMV
jgi:hypothetical protein